MLTFPDINPIAFTLGPLSIRWYGVCYLLGFVGCFWLCYRRRLQATPPWQVDDIIDLFFYIAIGVIFGGTWGFLLFYQPQSFLADPLQALRFWEPGRSFHGGLIGVIIAIWIYGRFHHRSFLSVTDYTAAAIPLGLALGRLGNFINAELPGRPTTLPWGIVFPHAGSLPRHPSQLYELGLEGIALLIILQLYTRTPKPAGTVSGLFLIFYGIFRFAVEFVREPDVNQGFVALGWLTKGQLLSLPMIVLGFILFVFAKIVSANINRTADGKKHLPKSI